MSAALQALPSTRYLTSDSDYSFFPQFTSIAATKSAMLDRLAYRLDEGDLDYDALNVFFRIGTFVGTDSCFRHIKADPPDYKLIATIRHVDASRTEIIDTYIDLFRQAVGRCMAHRDDIGTTLTGGRDSRHIVLELCRSGRKPACCWTVDIPFKPSEAAIAKQICSRLGIKHNVFRPSGKFADVEAEKDRLTSFSSLQHAWLAEALSAGIATTPVLFEGIGGDVLSAGPYLTEVRLRLLREHRIDELVEEIVGPEEDLAVVRNVKLFSRQRALEKVNEEFRRHLRAADPISSFFFWNKTRRDIACAPFALMQQHCQKLYAPYLDSDLVRFLSGISPSVTADHNLHTDAIVRAFPNFADMPYAAGYIRTPRYFQRIGIDVLRYLWKNPCPMIKRKKVFLQLLRASLSPKHAPESMWLGPYIVYLTELSKGLALS